MLQVQCLSKSSSYLWCTTYKKFDSILVSDSQAIDRKYFNEFQEILNIYQTQFGWKVKAEGKKLTMVDIFFNIKTCVITSKTL